MTAVKIMHFSDVLCIWAHVGQKSLYKLAEQFGDKVEIETHFCSVFPDTQTKINKAWQTRGGFDGYADHVKGVASRFEGFEAHPDAWSKIRPLSSASPHLFIKAIELLDQDTPAAHFPNRPSDQAAKALRTAFFTQAQDISCWPVQQAVSEEIGLDYEEIRQKIETGEAIARLAADYDLCQSLHVQGSPTYILNDGRQILFGNISYGILKANVSEVLSEKQAENASTC